MIVYEVVKDEAPDAALARLAVLEALAPMHLIRPYDSLDDLRAFLDAGLEDIRKAIIGEQCPADTPVALTRCWLFYADPAAIEVVGVRMAPAKFQRDTGFERWAVPSGWLWFYEQIAALRVQARRYDPQLQFVHA